MEAGYDGIVVGSGGAFQTAMVGCCHVGVWTSIGPASTNDKGAARVAADADDADPLVA